MKRNYSIDIIKFFAMFFIVCVHVQPFSNMNVGDINGNVITNLIVTFGRFAVPFFFAISGYLLCERLTTAENPQVYFLKYIKRNVKLYTSWLLFYFIFDITMVVLRSYTQGQELITAMNTYFKEYSVWKILYFGTNTTSYPLWFLLALVWSVIVVALFYKRGKIKYLLSISLGLNLIGQFGQSYYGFIPLNVDTKDALFFGIFYTTLGFFISQNQKQINIRIKMSSKQLMMLFILFSFIQIMEMFLLVENVGVKGGNYYLSTIPLVIILMLIVLKSDIGIRNRAVLSIGRNAGGIFITHNFVITFIYSLVTILGMTFVFDTILWHLLFVPFVFVASHFYYMAIQIIKSRLKKIADNRITLSQTQ